MVGTPTNLQKSTEPIDEVAETVRLGGIRKILTSDKSNNQQSATTPTQSAITNSEPNKLFDHSTATEFCGIYARKLLKENRRSLAAFLADPIITVHGTTLKFVVGSKNVAREIEDETPRLIKKAKLEGWKLTEIECSVNAAKVSEYKVFSPKQQFDVLAKEYPILKEFEARFNLDFDA